MMKLFIRILILNIFLMNPSLSEIVNDLDIKGNQRISDETILVLGDIDLGTDYNTDDLNNIIKRLYDSDFFQDVSVNLNNNTLIVTLIENPIIEDIQINGIRSNQTVEKIIEAITLKNRKSFTEGLFQKDLTLIKNILKTNGYYFVEVTPSISKNDELNSIRISIDINEGPRARLKNISFIGDKKIKDKKLLEIIASEEHKFWKFISNNVYLNQSRINLDKRLIENYYKNLGFYKVEVLSSFAEFNKNGNFNLIFNINAGDHYYFNDFKLELPDDYNAIDFDNINKTFSKLKGEKYSVDEFNKILSDIEKIASLRLYDFIDAKVDEEIIDKNKINFIFKVEDSTKFYVERVNILGNFTTIEEVIRNRLIVDEGDPLNTLLYNKSLDEIRSLRIFKTVKGEIKDGSNENLKIIDIKVEEQPTGEISLAAGVGTSGTVIGGGINEKNFLGKGINLDTFLEVSEDTIKGNFTYSKPNFAYSDNSLFTSLSSTSTDNLADFGYKVSEIGFSVGTNFEQYENLFFSPSIRTSFEDLETNNSASASLKKQKGNYKDLYFNYGLDYDLRNSGYKPSSGNKTSFYQELPMVSDNNEVENTFVFTQYKQLSRTDDMVGKASVYLKAINTIDNSDVRISKRATIPYSRLRGFQKGKVGPIDNLDYVGGNYVSAINLSTNLPSVLSTVETIDFALFMDVANVWGVDYDSSIDDSNFIRSTAGIGMDVLTPVGPLSFSLSQPLTKKDTDRTETFRFNLGTSF